MTPQPDPYRTLGLVHGATLNEIRSAYRRLAKQYHPDAAGERALPRFLAIQAAYERLVDGEGRLRTAARASPAGASRGGASGAGQPREPWRADPERARASRDAWRARRAPGAAEDGGATPPPGSPHGDGAGRGSRPRSGHPAPGATSGGGHSRRTTRKARPGSTTYDEAAAPLDPSWAGGAWYGPSSGTYWTLNPREYADPRKHGPEYQARARRADGAPEPDQPDAPGSPVSPPASPAAPVVLPDLESVARRFAPARLLALARRPDRRWRVLLALVGWPPVGLALGSILLGSTGCAQFAATCPEPARGVALVVQPLVVLALALAPVAAAVAAFASFAALAVAIPVAAVLAVGTAPESRAGEPVLGVAIAVAWVVAVAAGARSVRRASAPEPADPPPPAQ